MRIKKLEAAVKELQREKNGLQQKIDEDDEENDEYLATTSNLSERKKMMEAGQALFLLTTYSSRA